MCTNCALVLTGTICFGSEYSEESHIEFDSEYVLVKDMCHNLTLPDNVAHSSLEFKNNVRLRKLVIKTFSVTEWIVYCIYNSMCKFELPVIPYKIQYYTNINVKVLRRIDELINQYVNVRPEHFVETFKYVFDFTHDESIILKSLCCKMGTLFTARPHTICSAVLHVFCQHQKKRISLSKICNVFNSAPCGVRQLCKEKQFVSTVHIGIYLTSI